VVFVEMSLRASAQVDVCKKRYKLAVDADTTKEWRLVGQEIDKNLSELTNGLPDLVISVDLDILSELFVNFKSTWRTGRHLLLSLI